jgi:plasmid replication initiation protein
MEYNDEYDIAKARECKVVKSNEMIQRARFQLTAVELKALAYVISKIKPDDTELKEYTFDIKEYCKVCGLDYKNGKNYFDIKKLLKGLRDKSFWVTLDNGKETTCSWVNKVWIDEGCGQVEIRLDDDIQKYLINLSEKFTQYELLSTLPMKSQYSFRLYEILKSYAFTKRHTFNIDELKKTLNCENYERYPDFRRKVLEVAMKEINKYTDLDVKYEPIKKGKKVYQLKFCIKERKCTERLKAQNRAVNALHGVDDSNENQLTIFDIY